MVLDCSKLSFGTSASLVRLLKYARCFHLRRGEFKLTGLSAEVTKVARLVKLDEKLDIHPNVAAALQSLSPGLDAKAGGQASES